MKTKIHSLGAIVVIALMPVFGKAQINTTGTTEEKAKIYKFEPTFLGAVDDRRLEIDSLKQIIDTLQITDRKRVRMLKDLYKNGTIKLPKKEMLADTKFEDVD